MIISDNVIDEHKFLETFDGSIENLKSAYTCVRFLLLSAARFGVTKDVFSIELQQLGLPREHSIALGKVLDDKAEALKNHLRQNAMAVNELKGVKCSHSDDGIDCVKMELEIEKFVGGPRKGVTKQININKADVPSLLKELKLIKCKMDEMGYE
jgi:COMM domain containing 4